MSKANTASVSEYRDLIKEVYIDPIRTVVVIDDEFPTLDNLIDEKLSTELTSCYTEEYKENADKVRKILAACRHNERRWMVDVHDGKTNNDPSIGSYLHQTDLMILDYHLDGNDGNGDKAIAILKELAKNNHFNMVIVYTKGYGSDNGEMERVINEIALGLTFNKQSSGLSTEKEKNVKEQFNDWDDDEEGFSDSLKPKISEQMYLSYRSNPKNYLNQPEFQNIRDTLNQKTISPSFEIKVDDIVQWLLFEKQKNIQKKLSDFDLGQIFISESKLEPNWIRTDRLFLTVVKKSEQPDTLPDKLLNALDGWCPAPHRLLMNKMRFLIDDLGVFVQTEVLSDRYTLAGWLKNLIEPDEQARNHIITNSIEQHWKALGEALRNDIKAFADNLVDHLTKESKSSSKSAVIKKHSGININDALEKQNINKYINCYKSTKPVDGFHLTTGHILEVCVDSEKEYWICLSPACDLVPKKNPKGIALRADNSMPFTAVKLEKANIKNALTNITHNIFLLLKIDNEIDAFTFHPNGDIKTNPAWEQLIAEESGRFELEKKELQIWRLGGSENDCIVMKKHSARIVAQLQYEYALNLLQRFAATQSRVGLDFSKPD